MFAQQPRRCLAEIGPLFLMAAVGSVSLCHPAIGKPLPRVPALAELQCGSGKRTASISRSLVFIGDSITDEWRKVPQFSTHSDWINRGQRGESGRNGRYRFCRAVVQDLPYAVHIMYGTNDLSGKDGPISVDETFGIIAAMAKSAEKHGIRPIIGSVVPSSRYWWAPNVQPATKIIELNKMLKAFAAANCFGYADYWAALADRDGGMRRGYSSDGVHPNAAGYVVMMPVLERSIADLGANCGAASAKRIRR